MALFTSLVRSTDSKTAAAEPKANTTQPTSPCPEPATKADHVCESCAKELDGDVPASYPAHTRTQTATATSPGDAKAVRAYEYERQRTRRAADRARAKEGKAMQGRCGCCQPRTKSGVGASGRTVRERWDEKVSGEDVLSLARYDEDRVASPTEAVGGGGKWTTEVMMEDLLRQGKLRKGKAGDFELIPHVRSVIVLEDHEFENLDMDETWEHVSSEEDELVRTPSYAEIVSNTK